MGAETFYSEASGKTADSAFAEACSQARYDHGHSGYTGSIAEKHDFVKIAKVDTSKEAYDLAGKLLDEQDSRIDDKWGPAGCIEFKGKASMPVFLFFGWASS